MNNPYLTEGFSIKEIVKETEIDWTFRIDYKDSLIGGQFMQVSVPGAGEAPISISDFKDGLLDLTIRKVGRLTDCIFDLKPGDNLYMRGPYGNGFDLESYYGSDLIVIAGGTGLAPVKNVVKHYLNDLDKLKSFSMITGFKSPEDILYKNEIFDWSKKINHILTVDREAKGWNGHVGLVTKHLEEMNLINTENMKAIVVGPPLMMKFTTLTLLKLGFKEENITVSFERNMSCGIGKCGHCKIDETYVCLEGPVFNYTKAKGLLD